MKTGKLDFVKIGMKAAGLAAGGIGADVLVKHLPASIDEKIRPFILIAAGALAPAFLAPKNELVSHIGDGMIASGASAAVRLFMPSLVSGVGLSPERAAVYGATTISDLSVSDDSISITSENVSGTDGKSMTTL